MLLDDFCKEYSDDLFNDITEEAAYGGSLGRVFWDDDSQKHWMIMDRDVTGLDIYGDNYEVIFEFHLDEDVFYVDMRVGSAYGCTVYTFRKES